MTEKANNNPTPDAPVIYGLLAEFEDVDTLLHAAAGVRDDGFRRWDCYTPFPVHGLNKAMGMKDTRLPRLVFGGGVAGCLVAVALTVYTMAADPADLPYALQSYPYLISGKPYNSFPAFIPVIFELTVLLSAFAAVFGMFGLNRLPRLHHPLFNSERFRRATADRFFIAVEADDEQYDEPALHRRLEELGATHVEVIEDTD